MSGLISNELALLRLGFASVSRENDELRAERDQLRAEVERQNEQIANFNDQFSDLHVARNLLSRLSAAGFQLGDDAASSILAMRVEVEALKARERACPTMQEAKSRALMRGMQEVSAELGLADPSPAEVVAEVEALRKDAERYRWLREQHADGDADYAVMKFSRRANEWLHLDFKLDAEIDVALAAKEGA